MKIKVGNKIFDSNEEPVMLILSHEERNQIANMGKDATKYCSYPATDEWIRDDFKKIKAWMKDA